MAPLYKFGLNTYSISISDLSLWTIDSINSLNCKSTEEKSKEFHNLNNISMQFYFYLNCLNIFKFLVIKYLHISKYDYQSFKKNKYFLSGYEFNFILQTLSINFMEAYLIVVIVVMAIVLLAINIYLMILYIHPDDKGWGTAIYCKVLIVLGLTLCQAQALMVPLDVANRSAIISDAINMAVFWFFLYIIVLCFICILMPYAIFFYETDQDESFCTRIIKALAFTFASLVISALILFISWIFFKYVDLPYDQIALSGSDTGTSEIKDPNITEQIIEMQASLAVYIIAILSFFGWIFLILFGGVGLFALPIDMISSFMNRPIAKKKSQMKQKQKKLIEQISKLEKQGLQLQQFDQKCKNSQAGLFESFKNNRKLKTKMSQFRVKYYSVNKQFKIFTLQADLQNTNPLIPFFKLILGIIFLLTSMLWFVQILIGNVIKNFVGDRPLVPMLNEMFIGLENGNAGFVSTGIFAYLCLYMLWCVQKGNIKFGIRIPCCCRFHPMKKNETLMNSFLFNVILLSIASVGVIQLCINSFPTYTRNTQIYMIFGVQVLYMRFYHVFYRYNIFPIALLAWSLISLIYSLVTCRKKPKYLRDFQG